MTLADTNVLLRAIQRDNLALRAIARAAIRNTFRRGGSICVTPQNLIELWNVSTRPLEVNGLGMRVQDAERNLLRCEAFFTVLPETSSVFEEWKRVVRLHGVSGVKVHDARLVATMNVYAVKQVLTFDVEDFKRYLGIKVIHPSEIHA